MSTGTDRDFPAQIDGMDFRVNAIYAAGDTKISKDEGTEVNTTNGFTAEGTGYAQVFTIAEMTAKRIIVYIVDQGAKSFLDDYVIIETTAMLMLCTRSIWTMILVIMLKH